MAMTKYEDNNGHFLETAPGYICSQSEFTTETSAPNGATLMVVDESSHTVVGYYVAYNRNWNAM